MNEIDEIEITEPLGKSDHAVLIWKYQLSNLESKQENTTKLNFAKANFQQIKASLQATDWSFLEFSGTEDMWSGVKEAIQKSIKSNVPLFKKKRNSTTAPWWNRKLTKEVKLKHKAFKVYCQTKSEEDFKKHAAQRNITTSKIRKMRNKYECSLLSKTKEDHKSLYKYIGSQQKIKPAIQAL